MALGAAWREEAAVGAVEAVLRGAQAAEHRAVPAAQAVSAVAGPVACVAARRPSR